MKYIIIFNISTRFYVVCFNAHIIDSAGHLGLGHYPTSLQEALTRGSMLRPHDEPLTTKMMMLWSEYIKRNYHTKFYGKAQNLRRVMVKAYDDVLKKYDALILPTIPCKPIKLPTVNSSTKGE